MIWGFYAYLTIELYNEASLIKIMNRLVTLRNKSKEIETGFKRLFVGKLYKTIRILKGDITMLRTFETDRLILRERTLADIESCIEMDREPEVVKYIPEVNKLVNGTSANERKHREFIRERTEAEYPEGMGYWVIESKEDQRQFVGWILLIPLDAVGPEIEIGWRLKRKYWGKGYATEAAKVILQYAFEFLEIKEVVAYIDQMNKGSIRVAEKIGLVHKGGLETDNYIRYSIHRH